MIPYGSDKVGSATRTVKLADEVSAFGCQMRMLRPVFLSLDEEFANDLF
jgi:hypothetical protein